jgi:hypothetical protein
MSLWIRAAVKSAEQACGEMAGIEADLRNLMG